MDSLWAGMQDPAWLICAAILLIGCSGFPGLLLLNRTGYGQTFATGCTLLGSLIGFCGALALLLGGHAASFTIVWTLPFGSCDIEIDSLATLFLLPIFTISGCAALYAGSYWPAHANRGTEPLLTVSLGVLCAAMAVVVIAHNGILFLMAWEIMALAAGLALTVDHRSREVRQAGTVYLIATHTGSLALFVMFVLLKSATGSFVFPSGGSLAAGTVPAAVIFLCAFVGFGSKAGLMPLHIWLPGAHANAPSHISALMSGVMLKMGVYGIIRTVSLFHGQPLWWGALLLGSGLVSALLGIIFAIAQNDIKRLLAYSSIENIGIIAIGLGVALIGDATHRPLLGLLGLAGALLHILNHSMFKPLLFFGAGAMIHAAGTRSIDLMGGLARRMPWMAAFLLAGVVSICGLPPFNGFAGEFFLYSAFFTDATRSPVPYLCLAAPLLALVGGLATLCFVKLFGLSMLGNPRGATSSAGHEPGWPMLGPMGGLALLCITFGLVPQLLLALIFPAVTVIAPGLAAARTDLAASAPLQWLTVTGLALLVLAGMLAVLLRHRLSSAPVSSAPTWGCGYVAPAVSMQYSASSFAEPLVKLFATVVRQCFSMPRVAGCFPDAASFRSRCPETIIERLIVPAFRGTELVFSLCRRFQHGEHQLYILYIFATLVLLMVWAH